MTDDPLKIINNAITRMLARREHSCKEIRGKLLEKELDPQLCEQQLVKFIESNIQSDQRFVEMFVRSKILKGQGKIRIKAELAEHEICSVIINSVFSEIDTDWFALAHQVIVKKYGRKKAKDWQELQKRQRFLQYRGFDFEQIKFAVEYQSKDLT